MTSQMFKDGCLLVSGCLLTLICEVVRGLRLLPLIVLSVLRQRCSFFLLRRNCVVIRSGSAVVCYNTILNTAICVMLNSASN